MTRQCAWCKGFLGRVGDRSNDHEITHGICESCLCHHFRTYYDLMRSRGVLFHEGSPVVNVMSAYSEAAA